MPEPRIKTVFASRNKVARVEPIYPAYEKGFVHHVYGLDKLEEQMTEWDYANSNNSPDRIDSLTWLLHDLLNIGAKDTDWVLGW